MIRSFTMAFVLLASLGIGCGQPGATAADGAANDGLADVSIPGTPSGGIARPQPGTYTSPSFGTLVLRTDGTYERTFGCNRSGAGLHCFAIGLQKGTYEVVTAVDPAFFQRLILTDQFGQTLSFDYGVEGATLTLVDANQKTYTLSHVEQESCQSDDDCALLTELPPAGDFVCQSSVCVVVPPTTQQ
jgi:hypothetical protein